MSSVSYFKKDNTKFYFKDAELRDLLGTKQGTLTVSSADIGDISIEDNTITLTLTDVAKALIKSKVPEEYAATTYTIDITINGTEVTGKVKLLNNGSESGYILVDKTGQLSSEKYYDITVSATVEEFYNYIYNLTSPASFRGVESDYVIYDVNSSLMNCYYLCDYDYSYDKAFKAYLSENCSSTCKFSTKVGLNYLILGNTLFVVEPYGYYENVIGYRNIYKDSSVFTLYNTSTCSCFTKCYCDIKDLTYDDFVNNNWILGLSNCARIENNLFNPNSYSNSLSSSSVQTLNYIKEGCDLSDFEDCFSRNVVSKANIACNKSLYSSACKLDATASYSDYDFILVREDICFSCTSTASYSSTCCDAAKLGQSNYFCSAIKYKNNDTTSFEVCINAYCSKYHYGMSDETVAFVVPSNTLAIPNSYIYSCSGCWGTSINCVCFSDLYSCCNRQLSYTFMKQI